MADESIPFRYRLEYGALRAFGGLVRALPHGLAMALGWKIAWIGHYLAGFRRAEARRRIRSVLGPGATGAEVRRIAWVSWRNLCFNAIELLRLPELDDGRTGRTDFTAIDRVVAHTRTGRGAIVAVPHAGNWDLAGLICHRLGLPVFFIARRQKNPLTDAHLNRLRAATGTETVLNDSGLLRRVIRKLREGRALAILPDVRARTPALNIPFLGGVANLGAGMALFARQAGVPIYPAFVERDGWSRLRLTVFDPVEPDPALDKEADWERMTKAVLAVFDREIRRRPDQYFWFNKRWVLDPLEPAARAAPGAPAEAGP